MLTYALNISTNVFCQYCPRREGLRRREVLRSRSQSCWKSATTTLDRKRTIKRRHHVWWVEVFFSSFYFIFSLFFFFWRSVNGWMRIDVWVNVFRMPFLCADSGPWREMSRAWPPMSVITTSSSSTCPSHQESAWWAAEARQERVIVEVDRKGIVVGKCWRMRWTLLQKFSVSTVLGEKASDVVKSWGAGAKLTKKLPTITLDRKRTIKRRHHVWWVEVCFSSLFFSLFLFCFLFCFFVCFLSVNGWMGMDVWVNVFRTPFLCADSGPWREMSRAWPAMSSITTSSASTCPSHQESALGVAEARQERVIVEVVRKGFVVGKCWRMRWIHLQMFSVSTVLGEKASDVEKC